MIDLFQPYSSIKRPIPIMLFVTDSEDSAFVADGATTDDSRTLDATFRSCQRVTAPPQVRCPSVNSLN